METFMSEKRKNILNEIEETEGKLLPQIQKQNIIKEAAYDEVIEEIARQEEDICRAVQNYGSKLRENVKKHKDENLEKGNKIHFTEQMILRSLQEAKEILQSNDHKAILQYSGMKMSTKDSIQPLHHCIPQLEGNYLQQESVASLFGKLVFKPSTNKV
jgi:hypothetical protein